MSIIIDNAHSSSIAPVEQSVVPVEQLELKYFGFNRSNEAVQQSIKNRVNALWHIIDFEEREQLPNYTPVFNEDDDDILEDKMTAIDWLETGIPPEYADDEYWEDIYITVRDEHVATCNNTKEGLFAHPIVEQVNEMILFSKCVGMTVPVYYKYFKGRELQMYSVVSYVNEIYKRYIQQKEQYPDTPTFLDNIFKEQQSHSIISRICQHHFYESVFEYFTIDFIKEWAVFQRECVEYLRKTTYAPYKVIEEFVEHLPMFNKNYFYKNMFKYSLLSQPCPEICTGYTVEIVGLLFEFTTTECKVRYNQLYQIIVEKGYTAYIDSIYKVHMNYSTTPVFIFWNTIIFEMLHLCNNELFPIVGDYQWTPLHIIKSNSFYFELAHRQYFLIQENRQHSYDQLYRYVMAKSDEINLNNSQFDTLQLFFADDFSQDDIEDEEEMKIKIKKKYLWNRSIV